MFLGKVLTKVPFRESWPTHGVLNPIGMTLLVRDWWRRGRPAPAPHQVKLGIILFWADTIGAVNLVETGTWKGDTVRALQPRFDRLISIELVEALARRVAREHRRCPNVQIVVGDSAVRMPEVVASLSGPTVFWLDAHYSGGVTGGDGQVPIYAELDRVMAFKDKHVVIIDDMRCFDGTDGYPTQTAALAYLRERGYEAVITNDLLQAYLKSARPFT